MSETGGTAPKEHPFVKPSVHFQLYNDFQSVVNI